MDIKFYRRDNNGNAAGDSRRYRGYFDIFRCILDLLSQGPSKKTHVLNNCNLNSNTGARYLKMLEGGGAVSSSKEGREIYYSLTDKGMLALVAMKALYKLLLTPDRTAECKDLIRSILDENLTGYHENATLLTSSGIGVPVTFYLPASSRAVVVIDSTDVELALLYSSLTLAIISEAKDIGEVIVISPLDEGILGSLFLPGEEDEARRVKFIGGCPGELLKETLAG